MVACSVMASIEARNAKEEERRATGGIWDKWHQTDDDLESATEGQGVGSVPVSLEFGGWVNIEK